MGYEVHITRADDWTSNEDCAIEPSEWLDVIERDESLRLAGYNGPYFALWDGDSDDREAWLDLVDGNITTKSPSEALLQKMLEIADRLDARVQGDDGELYDGTTSIIEARIPSLRCQTSLLAFALSLVALIMLVIVTPLDSFIRQHYPVGTPMPLKWVLILVGPGMVGVLSWLASTAFAVAAFAFRQSSLRYALAALAVNCATGTYLVMSK
jgi:hypothetical protein